jgi:hypothetical protein
MEPVVVSMWSLDDVIYSILSRLYRRQRKFVCVLILLEFLWTCINLDATKLGFILIVQLDNKGTHQKLKRKSEIQI